jgi:hypothetical protein
MSGSRGRTGADSVPSWPCLGPNNRALLRLRSANCRSRKRQNWNRADILSWRELWKSTGQSTRSADHTSSTPLPGLGNLTIADSTFQANVNALYFYKVRRPSQMPFEASTSMFSKLHLKFQVAQGCIPGDHGGQIHFSSLNTACVPLILS